MVVLGSFPLNFSLVGNGQQKGLIEITPLYRLARWLLTVAAVDAMGDSYAIHMLCRDDCGQ